MIDRLEILASRVRRIVSRNRWSAFLLGLPPSVGPDDEPGLVLIQVDGLNEQVLRDAIDDGRMPFLASLVRREGYHVHSLYSGLPSSTPGFQAEFFYGIRTAVPAFGFYDRDLRRVMSMNDPSAAAAVESRLVRQRRGLLRDGSAWSNLFSGDAEEAHFCASTAGLDMLLRALNPLRLLGLVLWNLWSVVRVLATFVFETLLAVGEFLRRGLNRHDFVAELLFVPERVLVSAVMREVVTAGACVDTERGVPVVHLNLLGYDENAHRRGPRSRLALWTLRGLDKAIKRIWMAAHRSHLRDYHVWIYSDHGQEATVPWTEAHPEPLPRAVRHVVEELLPDASVAPSSNGARRDRSESGRAHWLRVELPDWLRRRRPHTPSAPDAEDLDTDRDGRPDHVIVIDQGPVGSVTFPRELTAEERTRIARAIAERVGVPLVLHVDDEGDGTSIRVHRRDGRRLSLPEDAQEIFGEHHPHLHEVIDDVVTMVRHEHAGDLVLMGFDPEQPQSLQFERGSHGGPGPHETSAFALLPPDVREVPARMRASDLRAMALRALDTPEAETPVPRVPDRVPSDVAGSTVRVMTYNVHGCRGMDGRFKPRRIARVIARQQPDVVCLQELDVVRGRSGGIDQARRIAEILEVDYHFHAVMEVDDGHFGNAVLSPHPIRAIASGPLPRWRHGMRLEHRGVLWVEVEVDGTRVQVLNTHLSIVERERRLQVDALLGRNWLTGPNLDRGVVLCGDFNAPGRSQNLQRMAPLLRNAVHPSTNGAGRPGLNTWSSRLPMRRIDHVFVSPDVRVQDVRVPRSRLTRVASDHLPVVADLWIPEN